MDRAIFQVFAFLEPCLYARSIVKMALRGLTKKHSFSGESGENYQGSESSVEYPLPIICTRRINFCNLYF